MKMLKFAIVAALLLLGAPSHAFCPRIPTGFVKELLAGKPYTEKGVTYKPTQTPKTLVQKLKDKVTNRRYAPGPHLEEIEPFDEAAAGGKTICTYRLQEGPQKTDRMLVLEATKAP